MNIQPAKKLAKEAFKKLKRLQTGEDKIVKTGEEMIDCHVGGLLPGDIIIFSALPGHGKSETLFRLKEKILDTKVNEEAEQFVFLDMSLEMKMLNIVLRGISRRTKKKKREILSKEFNKKEKKIVESYYNLLQDDRQFINQSPADPEEFYEAAGKFLKEHSDKKAVLIAIDHLLLMSGADKQKTLEQTVEYINQLKLEYDNSYFILLSQGNRNILGRVADKSNMSAPNAGDQYGSSFMDQITSYNIFIFNAYKVGIEKYMKVNADRYDYLADHFYEEKGGKASFETTGKIFYHVLKTRESDTPYKDIFIKDMELSDEILEKLKNKTAEEEEDEAIEKPPTLDFSDTEEEEEPPF